MSKDSPPYSAHDRGESAAEQWLSVRPLRNGPQLVLRVLGEADNDTAGHLRDSLLSAFAFTPAEIVVDVSGLTFCALAGLDALNDAVATAATFGIPLELRGMSPLLSWMHRSFSARPADPATRHLQPPAPPVLLAQTRR